MNHDRLNKNPNTCDLESALFELKCATGVVDAIQTAMAEGSCSEKSYTDALFGAVMYLGIIKTSKMIFLLYIILEAS